MIGINRRRAADVEQQLLHSIEVAESALNAHEDELGANLGHETLSLPLEETEDLETELKLAYVCYLLRTSRNAHRHLIEGWEPQLAID